MPYTTLATADTPMDIIYLIDKSASMSADCGNEMTRMDVVRRSLEKVVRVMLRRSMRGATVSPRYHVSMIAYNEDVEDLFGRVCSITELENMRIPQIVPAGRTNTEAAFEAALTYLRHYEPNMQDYPAPLVCHLTDGEVNEGNTDLTRICNEIRSISTRDGATLIQNIYIGDGLLREPIRDARGWPGVLNRSDIVDAHVQHLYDISSPLPDSYAQVLRDNEGYSLNSGVPMLIPAETPGIVELAFAMSGATPTSKPRD